MPHPKTEKTKFAWVGILGSLCALPAISGDLYLPCLPKMMEDLHTTQTVAQLTIASTMFGGAIGQMLVGPISDRFGRRKPVLIGLVIHVLISICCALTPRIELLIFLRLIQGAANASANVTAMAVNRDKFSSAKSAQMLSRLMLVVGVAPLFAPTLGTLMVGFGGWRAIFVLLAGIGSLLFLITFRTLPETHAEHKRVKNITIMKSIGLYREVLKDRQFICLALVAGLGQAVMMSWVMSAPFITQNEWKFAPFQFAISFALIGGSMVLGAQINAAIVRRFGTRRLLKVALTSQLLLAVAMLVTTKLSHDTGPYILAALFLVIFFHNFITANATAIALESHAKLAGTASAIIGITSFFFPSVVSPMVGVFGGNSTALALNITIILTLSITILTLGTNVFIDKSKLPSLPQSYPGL